MDEPMEDMEIEQSSPDLKSSEYILKNITDAERVEEKWRKRARKIVEVYRDERANEKTGKSTKFNILWANTETLKPSISNSLPRPDVRRRYSDVDPVGKIVSQIIERSLMFVIDDNDFQSMIDSVVEDCLLPGRGQLKVNYVPEIQTELVDSMQSLPDGTLINVQQEVTNIVRQEIKFEYVPWADFRMQPNNKWENVDWVAFRYFWDKDTCEGEFGEMAKYVQYAASVDKYGNIRVKDINKEMPEGTYAEVWQYWDRKTRKVAYVCTGCEYVLKMVEDPLLLKDFYPCPEPYYGYRTNDSMIPVPEYTLYQDQAQELDKVTQRIDACVDALRQRGIYDASEPALQRLLTADDNTLVPVENMLALTERGGMAAMIQIIPTGDLVAILNMLYQARNQIKNTIYEITGISDIVRGVTKASESATAQDIKAKFSGLRIDRRQKGLQRFVRQLMRISAELIANNFTADILSKMTGLQVSEDIVSIMRDDVVRDYRIDVETDQTSDIIEERDSVVNLLNSLVTFMNGIWPAVQSGFVPPEVAKSLMMAAVRRFKLGAEVEDALNLIGQQIPPMVPPPGMTMGNQAMPAAMSGMVPPAVGNTDQYQFGDFIAR